jgi:hypothetical protein
MGHGWEPLHLAASFIMAWPTTSSGRAGAVVEATRITHGLDRSRCCKQRTTEFASSVQATANGALFAVAILDQ